MSPVRDRIEEIRAAGVVAQYVSAGLLLGQVFKDPLQREVIAVALALALLSVVSNVTYTYFRTKYPR